MPKCFSRRAPAGAALGDGKGRVWGVLAAVLVSGLPVRAGEDTLMKAMRDELSRSIQQLQLHALSKPYFISYKVRTTATTEASASFGSLLSGGEHRTRTLVAMVRVGDYALDNTNFLSLPFGPSGVVHQFGGSVQLPLEDDYKEIRRQIWLATDGAYKKALEDFSRKRAALQTRTRAEDIPDFSREAPATIADEKPRATVSRAEAENLVRDISGVFTQLPDVFNSTVHLEVLNFDTRYVNSEGTSFTRTEAGVVFQAIASTQAIDGMPAEDFVTAYGRSMSDLPGKPELVARIREMGARLQKLRGAPIVEQYNGPVLLEGQAAAELFSQVFAPKLLAVRRPLSDNPQFEVFFAQQQDSLLEKIGTRVLPDFLSVIDNPLLDSYDGVRLVGGYGVDDEGVRVRETRLIEKGILKTLLASRHPVPGISRSTGNNQGGSGPTPSNVVVACEKGLTSEELKSELLKLAKQRGKQYGIVVRRLANPVLLPSLGQMMLLFTPTGMQGATGRTVIVATKVFPDGREELIRNAELMGVTTAAFKDIVAASKTRTVYSTPFLASSSLVGLFSGGTTAEAGGHILSFIVPSLLFEDLTLRRPAGEIPHPPISRHPYFDR